jgi:hypothetical protein
MAPHTPRSLGRGPGNPDRTSGTVGAAFGGPDMAPHTPQRSHAPRETRGAAR